MNKLISIVLVCITLMSTGVLAHSDHAHGYINDQQARSFLNVHRPASWQFF